MGCVDVAMDHTRRVAVSPATVSSIVRNPQTPRDLCIGPKAFRLQSRQWGEQQDRLLKVRGLLFPSLLPKAQ